jgi:hypothetical protein
MSTREKRSPISAIRSFRTGVKPAAGPVARFGFFRAALWAPSLILATVAALAIGMGVTEAEEESRLVDRLLATWGQVRTVTCSMREETRTVMGVTQNLSRIRYERPNQLNIERTGADPCRIVSDGRMFYQGTSSDMGIGIPIRNLDPERRIVLHSVPGSPMEHLLPLIQAPETNLPPVGDFPLRRGYSISNQFVILSCDALGRLCRIETLSSDPNGETIIEHNYISFMQIATNCWLPRLHETRFNEKGVAVEKKKRIDAFVANQPLSPAFFNYALYFRAVTFTNRLDTDE